MANPTTYFGWVMPNSADLVTDLPADFNTFGQGVDTSLQDLLGGTTGQVLSKTSGTNMDFTWVTPTDQTPLTTKGDLFAFSTVDARLPAGANETRLVADSAQTLGLKYVADTTNYAIAAKADLLVGTAADTLAALTVGTNGQVLTADSTVSPTGLKWASPASSAQNFALISSTALTGAATITVSSLSGYNQLMIIVDNVSTTGTYPAFTLRFNSDSTSKYSSVGLAIDDVSYRGYRIYQDWNTQSSLPLGEPGSSAADYGGARILVSGANAAGIKTCVINSGYAGTTSDRCYSTNGIYTGTSVISSVSLLSSSGNFDAGTIYVYGAA
jgi:hypothetical protein